jgi:hypothetical protein
VYEGVDTVILYEELAYQDTVPLRWQSVAIPLTQAVNQYADRNIRVLQAAAALDEQGPTEKSDENSPHAADLLRLEMKMNLLLDLVGRILASNQPRPRAFPVKFNAQGASWKLPGGGSPEAAPKLGDEGMMEIFLKDCLPEPLRLFGRVAQAGDAQVKVKFQNPGEAVADLIEKLAFRRHRRQVADQRQPKSFDPSRTGRFKLP